MAYLRERKKEVDIDFSLKDIWQALFKAADEFDWEIEEKDENANRLTIDTAQTLTSYGSKLKVELSPINEKQTRMVIYGETPYNHNFNSGIWTDC